MSMRHWSAKLSSLPSLASMIRRDKFAKVASVFLEFYSLLALRAQSKLTVCSVSRLQPFRYALLQRNFTFLNSTGSVN